MGEKGLGLLTTRIVHPLSTALEYMDTLLRLDTPNLNAVRLKNEENTYHS